MAKQTGDEQEVPTPEPGSTVVPFRRLTGDEILRLDDRIYKDVQVPEWHAVVTIRSMTGTERDQLEGTLVEQRSGSPTYNFRNLRARTVAMCAVDSNPSETPGRVPVPLWAPDQVASLGKKNASAVSLLYNVAASLAGISDTDVDELTKALGNEKSDESGSN